RAGAQVCVPPCAIDRFACARGRRGTIERAMIRVAIALLSVSVLLADDGPQPAAVNPGGLGKAPSDAVVLFDGKDLSAWLGKDGGPAKWAVEKGAMVCKTGAGNIHTKQKFGSMQIHVEFATPNQKN